MTGNECVKLIAVLLEDIKNVHDHEDELIVVLVKHFRYMADDNGNHDRLADLLEQYPNCKGPFKRDDGGVVLPGRWVTLEKEANDG